MPKIYLSPSTQEFNQFAGGGNEEYYMNQIVDAMVPYLRASGIEFTRNNPGDSVSTIIERSNSYPYDLHLAIQSRATPDGQLPMRGIDVYHYAISPVNGEKAAYIIAQNLKKIYPLPNKVVVVPDMSMIELSETDAPAVMVELGYYDNPEDAAWIRDNINEIGRTLALSVAEFLNVPFVEAYTPPVEPSTPEIQRGHTMKIAKEVFLCRPSI